jgi:hypothetical protein
MHVAYEGMQHPPSRNQKKTGQKYPWPIFAYYSSMTFGGLENTNLKKIVISDFDL